MTVKGPPAGPGRAGRGSGQAGADQLFWAARLAALGAATAPIPFRSLTAERLSDALHRVVTQQAYARAAMRAAHHMATEDGAGQALKAVGQLTEG